ncbi:hypothetical protein HYV30_00505 [Candidatus Kaiserbacteria bacterium]|nr:hypothetical protein [Candidatus Kaiserbacteria bacterium]
MKRLILPFPAQLLIALLIAVAAAIQAVAYAVPRHSSMAARDIPCTMKSTEARSPDDAVLKLDCAGKEATSTQIGIIAYYLQKNSGPVTCTVSPSGETECKLPKK